jgi:hypothetical protein
MCALVELGREADALRWARLAREAVAGDPLFYYVACGYARAGYRDDARLRGLLGGLTTRP